MFFVLLYYIYHEVIFDSLAKRHWLDEGDSEVGLDAVVDHIGRAFHQDGNRTGRTDEDYRAVKDFSKYSIAWHHGDHSINLGSVTDQLHDFIGLDVTQGELFHLTGVEVVRPPPDAWVERGVSAFLHDLFTRLCPNRFQYVGYHYVCIVSVLDLDRVEEHCCHGVAPLQHLLNNWFHLDEMTLGAQGVDKENMVAAGDGQQGTKDQAWEHHLQSQLFLNRIFVCLFEEWDSNRTFVVGSLSSGSLSIV